MLPEVVTLPRTGLHFATRPGTSDFNSANACADHDEYGLRNYDLQGKVVFDIGAHVGGVALLAKHLGAVRVVAVEPVPENAALTRESAIRNDFQIDVVEAAAGAPDGMTMSYGWYATEDGGMDAPTAEVHAFIGNTGLGVCDGYQAAHVIQVETVTMQDLVDAYGLPFLVKLDCEGGEWPLLEEPITSHIEVLTGEYHPWISDQFEDAASYFTDNRAEVEKRLGPTHDLSFHGPDGIDAGYFIAVKRG